MEVFALFEHYGGPWITILSALAVLAYINSPKSTAEDDKDPRQLKRRALLTPWLLKASVVVALLCWIWNFRRLYAGDAYLRGAGQWAELSTALLGVILALAGWAWWSLSWRRMERIAPWVTYGLVLLMITSSGGLVLDAPGKSISQGYENPPVTRFIQGRLASLGCFDAAGLSNWRDGDFDGNFDALTAEAVISFKMANLKDRPPSRTRSMAGDEDLLQPDTITEDDFRLLARPFPFLRGGPKHCQMETPAKP